MPMQLLCSPKQHKFFFLVSLASTTPQLLCSPKAASNSNNHGLSVSMSANGSTPLYDLSAFKFDPIKESIVSREMTRRYMTDMITYADTNVVVVGAGSAGLFCVYELSKNPNVQIAIIEQSVSPGGGAWLGGQLLSAMDVEVAERDFFSAKDYHDQLQT